MNLIQYFILATILIVATGFLLRSKRYGKNKILIALIGMTMALTILIFPLYGEKDALSQVAFSFFYAVQTIFLNQDLELLTAIELTSIFNEIYLLVIYLIFLLEPLLTATAILSLLGNHISKLKMQMSLKKEVVIFSEINERTLTIAKNQKINSKSLMVFLDNQEKQEIYAKELQELKAIVFEQKVTDFNFKNKNCTYYLFSEDEEKNLTDALALLNKKNAKNTKIYVLNPTEEARVILDSSPKNGACLEIVNEIERTIYNQLFEYPIYEDSINNQISILIIGCGKVGLEYLKAVIWCGQVLHHKLNIFVVDRNANEISEKLNITCPELLNNYSIRFITDDIFSKKVIRVLDFAEDKNINHILVSMETEEKNIEVALFLRRYFLKQDKNHYRRMPNIHLWIENDEKKKQIDSLKHDNSLNAYHINAFGSIQDRYGKHSIVHSEIEQLAMQVHGVYDPDDIPNHLERFYELEYNKKSSRAVALHLKYKLYAVLKKRYIGDLEEDLRNNLPEVLEQYKQFKDDPVVFQELVENEHERWNAYVRTEGFTSVLKEEVAKYQDFTRNPKHFLAKLHPAIVEYSKLEEVETYLQKDYRSSDEKIIQNIEKILKKEIVK